MSEIDNIPQTCILNNVRYMADGQVMRKLIGTEIYSWGMTPIPDAPTAADYATSGDVAAGTYKIHVVAESMFGYLSNPWETESNPTVASVTVAADNHSIDVTMPIHGDPQVKYLRVYRTKVDEVSPFYFAGRVSNGTTTLRLNGNDDSLPTDDILEGPGLTADGNVEPIDDDNNAGPFKYAPPLAKSLTEVSSDGTIFVCGERPYTEGTCSIDTSGALADVVTFDDNVYLTQGMVGKTIKLEDEAVAYQISEILTPQSLRISVDYTLPTWRGTTDPTDVNYEIVGDYNEVFPSEPGLPEYFPAAASFFVGREDGGRIRAVRAYGSDTLFFTESKTYMVKSDSYITGAFNVIPTGSSYGCIAPRSAVVHSGACYHYTGDHIARYYNQDAEVISWDLGEILENAESSMKDNAISCVVDDRLYFAISLESEEYLDTIFVLDLKTMHRDSKGRLRGIWDAWQDFQILDMQVVTDEYGKQHLYIETPSLNGYTLNAFEDWIYTDGNPPVMEVTVTSATSTVLTVSETLPTTGAGLLGLQMYVRRGTGAGQKRWITGVTSSTITTDEPWDTVLDSTSEVTIGAIRMELTSGKITHDPHVLATLKKLEVTLETDS